MSCVLQTSYIRRERAYKRQVDELESQLREARRGGIDGIAGEKMEDIRRDHKEIMENIKKIHLQTANKIKGTFQVFLTHIHM